MADTGMTLTFTFDCPTKAYDLSLQSDWLTDEMKLEFDQWFEVPHEEVPKPPSDEEFFAKLLNPNQPTTKVNNENRPNNAQNNLPNNNLRKRPIAEVTSSSVTSLKASRTTAPSSSGLSSSTRPTKIVRPNPVPSSSSSSSASSTSTLTKATQSSILRATTAKATVSRAGSAPRARPTTASSATAAASTTAPLRNTQQQPPKQQSQPVASKLRSTSAGKVRPSVTSSTKAVIGKKASTTSTELDSSLEQLLKAHNAKFVPVPAYEPPKHSVRDVRKWEKLTGNLWCELKPEERQAANDQITKMKESNEIV